MLADVEDGEIEESAATEVYRHQCAKRIQDRDPAPDEAPLARNSDLYSGQRWWEEDAQTDGFERGRIDKSYRRSHRANNSKQQSYGHSSHSHQNLHGRQHKRRWDVDYTECPGDGQYEHARQRADRCHDSTHDAGNHSAPVHLHLEDNARRYGIRQRYAHDRHANSIFDVDEARQRDAATSSEGQERKNIRHHVLKQSGHTDTTVDRDSIPSAADALGIAPVAPAPRGTPQRARRVFEPAYIAIREDATEAPCDRDTALWTASNGNEAAGPCADDLASSTPPVPHSAHNPAGNLESATDGKLVAPKTSTEAVPTVPMKWRIGASPEAAPSMTSIQLALQEPLVALCERLSKSERTHVSDVSAADDSSAPTSNDMAVHFATPCMPATLPSNVTAAALLLKDAPHMQTSNAMAALPLTLQKQVGVEADVWISLHDSAGMWELSKELGAAQTQNNHPDAQPAPPGVLDLPGAVLTLAAQEESAAARAAATNDRADILNLSLLRACWPPACRASAMRAMAPSSTWILDWMRLCAKGQHRLVVLCGAPFAAIYEHPNIIEHGSVLVSITALSDEVCAARGGCDNLIELWEAMTHNCPLLFLETPCSTRRARKQLLYKLSKQSVASKYTWEVQVVSTIGALENLSMPSLEEGWTVVHQ